MKVVQLIATAVYSRGPVLQHLLALDDSGRIWERFSDQEPGTWSIVPGPSNPPKTKGRKPRK